MRLSLLPLMILALIMSISPLLAQGTPAPDAPPSAPISPELRTQLDTLEGFARSVRGWDTPLSLPVYLPERTWVADYLRGVVANEYNDDTVVSAMPFYTAFGFLPQTYDLRENLMDLYETQVAGFYDTELEAMVVILLSGIAPESSLPFLERATYIHEYTHALQDARYDLEALFANAVDVDAERALLALIEGDATLVMNAYVLQEAERNPIGTLMSTALGGLQAGSLTLPPELPAILSAELLFPYEYGLAFATALYQTGGLEALDASYANPPTTTEQILHPATYLSGEVGRDSTTLNALTSARPLPDTWALLKEGQMGEFYLRQYLRQYLPTSQANEGASGWDGDAYQIRQADDGGFAWRWVSGWDDAAERAQFMDAYRAWGEAHYGTVALDGCWLDTTIQRQHCFYPDADHTVTVTYLPINTSP